MKNMKNLVLPILFFAFFASQNTKAQVNEKNAIGIKTALINTYGTEISWQHKLEEDRRFEVGFNYNEGDFKLTGLHEWVWELGGNFNWFLGAGVQVDKRASTQYLISAAGNAGIEYNFKIPMQISLDVQPNVEVFGTFLYFNDVPFAVALRYKF